MAASTLVISIHRPLAGPDLQAAVQNGLDAVFQSTGPSRGPTETTNLQPSEGIFQSTGPSRGPTSACCGSLRRRSHFNPQAPRGARHHALHFIDIIVISIHRPLAGPDCPWCLRGSGSRYFNPQAPRGARHDPRRGGMWFERIFQSTGPSRGPTQDVRSVLRSMNISIHRPLAGPDIPPSSVG